MGRWALAGAAMLTAVCGAHATGADRVLGTPWLLAGPEAPGTGGRAPDDGDAATTAGPAFRAARAGPRPDHGRTTITALPWPPPESRTATVVRVVDGDTLILRIGGRQERVRLIGVDAPETWARHDCFGADATRALRRLAPVGAALRLVGDRRTHDGYGRRLAYLWTSRGRFIAGELVRAGFARAMVVPPNVRYVATLAATEATAHRWGAGLWKACPLERWFGPA